MKTLIEIKILFGFLHSEVSINDVGLPVAGEVKDRSDGWNFYVMPAGTKLEDLPVAPTSDVQTPVMANMIGDVVYVAYMGEYPNVDATKLV